MKLNLRLTATIVTIVVIMTLVSYLALSIALKNAYNRGVTDEQNRINRQVLEKKSESYKLTQEHEVSLVSGLKLRGKSYEALEQELAQARAQLAIRDEELRGLENDLGSVRSESKTHLPAPTQVSSASSIRQDALKSELEINGIWRSYCLQSDHILCDKVK